MSVPPFPAATAIVARGREPGAPECYLVRRTARASFLAGAHVFPGGRVDEADAEADPSWCDGLEAAQAHWPDLDARAAVAHHVAAVRELFEEAGLLMARDGTGRIVSAADASAETRLREARAALRRGRIAFGATVRALGARLALDALLPIGHWVTPAFESKRFDTRFFLVAAPPGQSASPDAEETTHGEWVTAGEALARYGRGEMVLFPPTWGTLRDLGRFASLEEMLASVATRRIFRREPRLVEAGGERVLVLPGDPLCPAPAAEHVTLLHPETRFVFDGGRWAATSVQRP